MLLHFIRPSSLVPVSLVGAGKTILALSSCPLDCCAMPIVLQATTRKTLAARLQRAGLFLAITLIIAGAFRVMEHVELSLVEVVARLQPDWVGGVSPALREEPGAVAPPTVGVRPANIPEELWQASPRLVWALGLKHGMAATVANMAALSETTKRPVWNSLLASFQDDVHKVSTVLNVPPPAPPVIRQRANAASEFAESLDEQPTAKALDQIYSSRHAALFRLGALSGYRSMFVRLTGSPMSTFALEIRRHGMATGLAKDFWQPLASPLSTSGKDAAAEFDQRLQRVSESLAPTGAGSP
jgi:hypothetical protein